MRLNNKVAIVTGGANGIGKCIVERYVEEGAKVYSLSIGKADFNNDKIVEIELDVTDRDAIAKVVNDIKEAEGKIDILVNNAGITKDGLTVKLTESDFDVVVDVNLKGVFNLTQAVVPVMLENEYGSIINISSVVGVQGNVGQSNYAATKSGVIGMTYSWAKEFPRKGANIRSNVIAPGYINTDMMKTVPDKILDKIKAKNPLNRLGEPKEIANAALFLASDESSYVNGTVLEVTGGQVL